MIPVSFDYQKAGSVEEAIRLLSDSDSKLLAGGHSLVPAMKLRLSRPEKLIDISGIAELKGIREEDGMIVIGAGCTHAQIGADPLIREKLSFFAEATAHIGDRQVRNYGTIGGSLAHADPAADWPALVLAADAVIEVQGKGGKRTIKSGDFFAGLFYTALQPDEIITAIRVPVLSGGTKAAYKKFVQPASRFAIVGCAVVRSADGKIRIAFTGVSDFAFRDEGAENSLSGKTISEESINAAADSALQGRDIAGDHFASSEYRKHLAKVYLKKALQAVA